MSEVILQNYVSRNESLRHHFSHLSWKRGMTNFYEGVPFSYSTSFTFINQVTELIRVYFSKNSDKEIVHFYELGSGTGMFMFNLIEFLNQNYPEIFNKLHFHISDYSPEIVEFYYHNPTYLKFKDKISCDVIDFCQLNFNDRPQPDILFMSYLWDAVDTIHLEYTNETLYEILVKTYIDHDDEIIDASNVIPEQLSSAEILAICKDDNCEKKQMILPKIVELIYEDFQYKNMDYSRLDTQEATFLKKYLKNI